MKKALESLKIQGLVVFSSVVAATAYCLHLERYSNGLILQVNNLRLRALELLFR